ncbi:MAG TPA: DNA/RNA nuclease SfsA [Candidatus Limnocylindrales bacterium]|nr:DNA/RNA nuclease SfsA [Candidatus Limnocylindrales bacterium]
MRISRPFSSLFLPHRYPGPLLKGRFIRRPHRFAAQVQLDRVDLLSRAGELGLNPSLLTGLTQEPVVTHVPDPGRLLELLQPGVEVYVSLAALTSSKESLRNRKTFSTLLLVRSSDPPYPLVSLDTPSANRLAEAILRHSRFSPIGTSWQFKREYKIGESRLDFYLHQDKHELFLEVKSVSLVKNQIALFPDAPTLRGVRHLHELIDLRRQGKQAAVLFVAQRDDLLCIRPNRDTDPRFATVLKEAYQQGVQLFGVKFKVSLEGYFYQGPVPVEI